MFPQHIGERAQRLAAVTACVLQFRPEFGRGSAALGIEEDGVIAEPACSPPLLQYPARPAALGNQRGRIVRGHENRATVECGRAALARYALHFPQQFIDVAVVGRIGAGVTRRVDARRAGM